MIDRMLEFVLGALLVSLLVTVSGATLIGYYFDRKEKYVRSLAERVSKALEAVSKSNFSGQV